jgi:HD-GYP domain-containing protein (c-di-GMP phosphodiesterase class II)
VKLVSFQPEYLRIGEGMPFGVRDADGRLLLAAGQVVEDEQRMAELKEQPLFAAEAESAQWFKRLVGAMDARLREGALLHQVAAARPEGEAQRDATAGKPLTLAEEWREVVEHLDNALREMRPGVDSEARVRAVHERARALAARRTDASLYLLIYDAARSTVKYSSHHAVLTMVISEIAAGMLAWQVPWIDSLGQAALLMNVSMRRLQDQLAGDAREPTAEMRAEIATHPAKSALMLQHCGFGDALCLETVRLHHDAGDARVPLANLPPAAQLARLLRRVDIFSAQISLRRSRAPHSPVLAAREACLGANGQPDEIGGALLRAVGMYPPGSLVELASGEVAIVVARGRRANVPYVAALLSGSGNLIAEPKLRDTLDQRYAVKSAVAPGSIKVMPPHEMLLSMRTAAEPVGPSLR